MLAVGLITLPAPTTLSWKRTAEREMDLLALWLPKFPTVFSWWGRRGCPHTGYRRCCVDWRGGKVSRAEDVRQGCAEDVRGVSRGD